MKYESNTKTGRNEEIYWLRKLNPKMPLREIAEQKGITKQRVSIILKREREKRG